MKKYLKGLLIGLAALLTLLLGMGYYMLGIALKPDELVTRSRNVEASYEHIFDQYPETRPWVDSLRQAGVLRSTWIANDEGENLHALCLPAPHPTPRTAVVVHGYTDNSIRMLPIAYLYNKVLGYNVLLPDLHGHGLSEGNEVQMGWKDRLDVLLWTEYAEEWVAREQNEAPQIVVHGISMGAATTMMVSGEVQHGVHQQPYVKCFVEDCGYTSAWDEFAGELKNRYGLPAFPVLHVASLLCGWEYGWQFDEASALNQVKRCTLPMLFIHGDEDTFVPTWMVHPLYEAKPEPKELWTVPGVDHAHSYRDARAEYTQRVAQFVGKYMK